MILAQKYKYLNHYALIHLLYSKSASYSRFKDDIFYLTVLFYGNILFDYHINKNPKDFGIFIHYYK